MGRVAPTVRKSRSRSVHREDQRSRDGNAERTDLRDRVRASWVRTKVGTFKVLKRSGEATHSQLRDQPPPPRSAGSTQESLADKQDALPKHPGSSQTIMTDIGPQCSFCGRKDPSSPEQIDAAKKVYQPFLNQQWIAIECDQIKEMLLEKNLLYGDSVLNPVRIASKASPIEQILVRIDDKLSRWKNLQPDESEDVVKDLIGYLILLRIAHKS